MHRILLTTTACICAASAASAAGIERAPFSPAILFEDGNYTEFSLGYVRPEVDGTFTVPAGPAAGLGLGSGDVAGDYFSFGAAVKGQIDENWSWALLVDNGYGADVDYSDADTGYPLAGLTAEVNSVGLTGLVMYTTANNLSFYGGLRYETLEGVVNDLLVDANPDPAVTTLVPYDLSTDTSKELGYVLGVAWEKPEIAARVALTYMSARDHELAGSETINGASVGTNTFTTTIPQSVTLDFQTGVAADTLVFGSVKWTEWSEFDITPVVLGNPLVAYQDDVWGVTLGVGRRFNETWSGAITLGHETGTGQPSGNLGPTEGQSSIGLGVTYTDGPMKVTTGIRYIALGDTTTQVIGAEFEDNSAIAAGVRIGYSF